MNKLSVRNLELQRGLKILQTQIEFELKAGECLWVKGPNGVGKSTLLETLCGFRPNISGELLWNDELISSKMDEYHHAISYLGHKNGNNDNLTAKEALRFYDQLYESDCADEILQKIGLGERSNILVKELSAGQQKRLAIGRILLRNTPLWILDEPSVSLDVAGVEFLVEEIEKRQNSGGMIIYTSHVDLGLKSKILELKPMTKKAIHQADEFLGADWEDIS